MAAYRRAADLDPGDTWTWIFISRLERAAGRLVAAAAAAEEETLARSANEHDRMVALNTIGEVRVGQGDLSAAHDVFLSGQAIVEKLAAADPSNAGWQRDLIVSHRRIADVAEKAGDAGGAQEHFTAALTITRSLAAAGRLASVDAYFIEALAQRLGALEP